ncbi:MAG: hypothetical protein H5T62_14390 [Anaerolineae bacterium]|nr:hypothetical protein [Anaerolineae bacterium]
MFVAGGIPCSRFRCKYRADLPRGRADEAALDEASPLTYVRAEETLPPFYVLYCENDMRSLPEQAIAFRDQLEAEGHDVEGDYLAGYTHVNEMTAIASSEETVTQLIIEYIETHIRKTIYLPLVVRSFTQ